MFKTCDLIVGLGILKGNKDSAKKHHAITEQYENIENIIYEEVQIYTTSFFQVKYLYTPYFKAYLWCTRQYRCGTSSYPLPILYANFVMRVF